MSPLVEQAMITLSTRCNRSALHPNDEDTIKTFLKALHKNGEDISPSILSILAQAHNWQANPTKQLLKWAEAISMGRRVVIKNKMFVESEKEIIKHLEKQASVE